MASEQEIIAAQAAEIERLRNKVASLEDQLYWLRKKMFGKMSEKNLPLDPSVLSEPTLFDDPRTDEERAELEAAVKKDEEDAAKLIQVRGFERKPRKAVVPKYRYTTLDGEEKLWTGQGKTPLPLKDRMAADGVTDKEHYRIPAEEIAAMEQQMNS